MSMLNDLWPIDHISDGSSNYPGHSTRTSPSLRPESLAQEAVSSSEFVNIILLLAFGFPCANKMTEQALQAARGALTRAQKEVQEAFLRYTACVDMEKQARQAVTAAEKRRDDISELSLVLLMYMVSHRNIFVVAALLSQNLSVNGMRQPLQPTWQWRR